MRRPIKNKHPRQPDLVYKSEAITRFINTVMLDGKKDTARSVVYDALAVIQKAELDPIETFETAIRNVSPLMEVRSRRVGGANYQVPREVPQQPCIFGVPLAHQCCSCQEGKANGREACKRNPDGCKE